MRYATFSTTDDATPRLGAVQGEHIIDIAASGRSLHIDVPATLLHLTQMPGDAERRVRELATHPNAVRHAVQGIRWHAPIPRPAKNVFCMGLNYLAHARESGAARGKEARLPARPVLFTKAPTTVSGPYDDVPVDWSVTNEVDWEVELGVVIGRGGRDIPRSDALGHVFGYTVINDLSARDLQVGHFQWFKGKSLDGFCPIGPLVVTADEFGHPQNKAVICRVNGVEKQNQRTSEMLFPVDVIIENLSHGLTLDAGDIIATGTPEGVGFGRNPPEFMNDGDVMETEVEGIGVMRNVMRRVDS